MSKNIAALVAGLLFGVGLVISQMINPEKVLAFLDILGNWDPSLLFVLGAAVGVNLIGYHLTMRRSHPVFDTRFHLPAKHNIDARLMMGAALFGVGWGLAGYCPGPVIAALPMGLMEPFIFLAAVLAGMGLYEFGNNRFSDLVQS